MTTVESGRRLRVIAVDDARTNLIMLGAILRAEGCDPRVTTHAAEAVAMARAETPDLVLLDLMMPDTDGITLCSWLRGPEVALGCPIVLLTALAEDEIDQRRLSPAGVDGVLCKPVDRPALRQWLAAARAGSRDVPKTTAHR